MNTEHCTAEPFIIDLFLRGRFWMERRLGLTFVNNDLFAVETIVLHLSNRIPRALFALR